MCFGKWLTEHSSHFCGALRGIGAVGYHGRELAVLRLLRNPGHFSDYSSCLSSPENTGAKSDQ
jgi:hypothetical protein